MKEKFNLKYIASLSEYDIPVTQDLYERTGRAIEDVKRANREGLLTKILKKPGRMINNLDKSINKFSQYAKSGPTGVLVGMSNDGADRDFYTNANHAIQNGEDSVIYKGKTYNLTPDIKKMISKMNPLNNKK